MPRERGARDAKEFGGLPLITRSLFVNEADVSGDGRSEREIAASVLTICLWQIWVRLGSILMVGGGGQIGRKDDMLRQDDWTIAEQGHGSNGVT